MSSCVDNPDDKKIIKEWVMAPMVRCDEFKKIHAEFAHHIHNTREKYDIKRRLCLNAPPEAWSQSDEFVEEYYSRYKCKPDETDTQLTLWLKSAKDDERGGARKFVTPFLHYSI